MAVTDASWRYYAMHGQRITMPDDPELRPARDALEWRQSNKFLG